MDELSAVVDRLQRRFGTGVPRAELRRVVQDASHEFDEARIKAFVPLLVERIASDRLSDRVRI